MELTKEILDAAYCGFKKDELDKNVYGINWEEVKNIEDIEALIPELFENGICPMFDKLDLKKPDKNISIHILDIENFTYAYYLQCMGCCYSINPLPCDLKTKALEYYNSQDNPKKTADTLLELLSEQYAGPLAFASDATVFVNKKNADSRMGLHLICHEIMHILANKETVANMRIPRPGSQKLQDEAVNEFFARLATYFFIYGQNEKVNERKKIAGLTCFKSDLFTNNPNHDEQLGLYGKLMQEDEYLQNSKWESDDDAVNYAKALAAFYFCRSLCLSQNKCCLILSKDGIQQESKSF